MEIIGILKIELLEERVILEEVIIKNATKILKFSHFRKNPWLFFRQIRGLKYNRKFIQKGGFKDLIMEYNKYNNFRNQEYNRNKFRVRSPVKSFRDLEVYQTTIKLSNLILNLNFLEDEKEELKKISESIPRLIAESYGDKFDFMELSEKKLDEAVTLVTDIITKLDILRERFLEDREKKEILDKLILKYGYQKLKILNLKKAWKRVFENSSGEEK